MSNALKYQDVKANLAVREAVESVATHLKREYEKLYEYLAKLETKEEDLFAWL
jgi:hypothetical protein